VALLARIDAAARALPAAARLLDAGAEAVSFDYPAPRRTGRIEAVTLERQPVVGDRLVGVKAQYLLFERVVLNVRRHAGFDVALRVASPS